MSRRWPVKAAQGRSEFGPRALGNRSILADPRTDALLAEMLDLWSSRVVTLKAL
jgi:predicted NodU family carbamoyl transferase